MKKIPRNTKAPIIILVAFLCALSAIYFYSDNPIDKADSIGVIQEPQESVKNVEEEEAENLLKQKQEQDRDIVAEIWARKEFLHHELTYGMDEDDEEDEEADLYKEDFAHDEMTEEEEEEAEEEELHDEMPLTAEEVSNEAHDDQQATDNEKESPAQDIQELKSEEALLQKELEPTQDEALLSEKKEVSEEINKAAHGDKNINKDIATVSELKSPFSTKAQVLPVVISNDPHNEGDFDPYEDIAMPDKIMITSKEEQAQIHQPEVIVQPTPIKEDVALQAPIVIEKTIEPTAELVKKEEQMLERRDHLSKAYAAVSSNVSYLMTKFLQKTDYTKELNSIDQTKLPQEVKEVLAEMKDFAEHDMQLPANNDAKIFPKEGVLDSIAGHFVKIEKVTDSKRRDEKYEQIRKKLHILEDYFYSQKFLKEMMSDE